MRWQSIYIPRQIQKSRLKWSQSSQEEYDIHQSVLDDKQTQLHCLVSWMQYRSLNKFLHNFSQGVRVSQHCQIFCSIGIEACTGGVSLQKSFSHRAREKPARRKQKFRKHTFYCRDCAERGRGRSETARGHFKLAESALDNMGSLEKRFEPRMLVSD